MGNICKSYTKEESFVMACVQRNVNLVIKYIHADVDLDTHIYENKFLLSWLCEKKDMYNILEIILLSKLQFNVNIRDNDGNTPLMLACLHDNFNAIKLLLQRKDIDINARNDSQESAITIAYEVVNKAGEAEEKKIIAESNENAHENAREISYVVAYNGWNTAIIKLLLNTGRVKFNESDMTIIRSYKFNDMEIINLLIMNGFFIDEVIITRACQNDFPDVVEMLLEREKDKFEREKNYNTIFVWACKYDKLKYAKMTVKNITNVNEKIFEEKTVIEWAFENKNIDLLLIVIESRKDLKINKKDKKFLELACNANSVPFVRLLVKKNIGVNADETKLDIPCPENTEIMTILLRNHIYCLDVFPWVCKKRWYEMIDGLSKYKNIDIHAKCEGKNAFTWVVEQNGTAFSELYSLKKTPGKKIPNPGSQRQEYINMFTEIKKQNRFITECMYWLLKNKLENINLEGKVFFEKFLFESVKASCEISLYGLSLLLGNDFIYKTRPELNISPKLFDASVPKITIVSLRDDATLETSLKKSLNDLLVK